tara:strand:+ start:29 stop:451 length:423 start_codon:yes stop_codon:yes gene_type:complete
MALGDNTAFFNETTFLLGDEQTTETTGISGIAITDASGGALSPAIAGKVLFTRKAPILSEDGPFTRYITDTDRDLRFEVKVMERYMNSDPIAVITEDRLAIQATPEGSATTASTVALTATAKGFNSVGPTLRRLHHLGYV